MKHFLLVTLILLIAGSLYARTEDMQEIYFSFEITERSELEQLTRIVSIDNVDGTTVYAYGYPQDITELKNLGYDLTELPHPGTLIIPEMAPTLREVRDWDYYPTYDQYIAMMYQFATDYPGLCRIVDIGSTVEGRQLLFAVISDNVSIEEDEPEFMYTSTMHGDETTGYVLMLRLIDYLLSNYGIDAEVTEMVNEIEIWINPNANPDGTYAGGNNTVYSATRNNANNVDLNRNFPDPEDGPHPDNKPWQPETIAMMDIAEANSFIHSANFHGGAEVVNYPWDTWNILHADDDWYIDISKAFADTVFTHSPYGYFRGVSNTGYIRGYAWYTTNGNRQDYMNWFHNCRETTIEISDTKLLPASQLEAHWGYLKRSFINYIKNVNYGIRGLVTDSLGNPLDAKITVVDHDFDHSEVYTDPDVGDYHRMLLPGTYDITVSAYAFIPQTIYNITVVDTGAVRVDVILQEAESVDITGIVRDGDTHAPIIGARVEIMDSVHAPVYTGFDGTYAIDNVMEGTYTFKVTADGYSSLTEDITVTQSNNVINFNLYQPYLFWDFEQNDGDFTSNNPSGWQWGEPSSGGINAYSGIKVWATNLSGYYVDNAHWYLDSPEIQLGNNPMLEFYHLHYFEGSSTLYDGGNVSISTNGGGSFGLLTPVGGYDGNISALSQQGYGGTLTEWTLAQFSLAPYANQEIVLRWHFASDYSVHEYYGWYVDDVAIIELVGTDDPASGNNGLVLGQNFPNPFRGSTTIQYFTTEPPENTEIKIFNIKGQHIKTLSSFPNASLGMAEVVWDGCDDNGKKVQSGVYFYQVQSEKHLSNIKKLIYLQ